jgi:hypothetical protein
MSKFDVYKALFPPYYSARSKGWDDEARIWRALELPYIRVFGPMWSFGLRILQLDDVKDLPGLGNAAADLSSALALRTLFQKAEPAALGALAKYQAPVLMRAEFDRFLQPTDDELMESRLSLLAVDTIEHTTDGALVRVHKDDLPVELDGKPHSKQAPIIVSPFGNAPRRQAISISDKSQYLPAMQMLHGLIRFKPTVAYLAKVRTKLGLKKPDAAVMDGDTIVLLPDGFAIAGSVVLPWMGEEDYLSGWFKATWRRLEGDDGMPERVLKLWFDPTQPGHDDLAKAWDGYLDQLDRVIRGSSGKARQPHWLAIGAGTEIMATNLVWPENNLSDSPLFSRVSSNKLSVDAAGLVLRLSNRPWTDRPLSVLTVQPPQFDIERRGDVVVLTASVGKAAPKAPSTVSAHYRFQGGQSPAEKLYFKTGGDDQRPIVLAVPLIEMADRLRQATGIARPEPGEPLGLLWTFSPVAGGWLHWPLPNATQSSLSQLLTEDNSVKPAPEFAPNSVLGALNFGNQPGTAGFDSTRREWYFSLAMVQEASLELRLDAPVSGDDPARYGAVLSASINLTRMALSFNGFAVVTPYRQTPQRLLPDHTERVLCSMPLRADSPESLIGIEGDLWRQQEQRPTSAQVNIRVELSNFSIEADAQGTAAIAPGATVAWTTSMTGASTERGKWAAGMQPWMWKSHPSLPVVQSMPMSAGGNARNWPLRSRALAPLMLAVPPQHGKLVYSGTLDMDSAGPDIAVADAGPAPVPATFQRPSAGAGWTDGIGMAVLTLPSVTLFAGTTARLQDVKQPSQWSALPTPVHIVLRSDLSLRDEHYGFARAPGPSQSARTEKKESDPPPQSEPVFSPLPDNGPGVNGVTNGWDRVWRSLQRKTALAALDRREMLARTSKALPYTLTGVFGNTDYDIKDQGIGVDLRTTFVDSDKNVVKQIGGYEIKFDGQRVEPAVMQFEGLPAASDLQGLNGTFERNGQAQEVLYGTAKLGADPKTGFTDQFGLGLQSTRANEVVTIKTLSGGATATTVRLVSLNAVLDMNAGQPLQFFCVDVPVGENLLDMFSADKGDLDVRSNSAGLDYNHLAGFRWSLTCPSAPPGFVIVEGLVFEPLELAGFTLDAEDVPAEIKVRGSLRLPVRTASSTEQTLPQAGGEAILTITCGKQKNSVALSASKLSWPLADPATFPGKVPTLHIAALAKVGAVFSARLHYRFGERDVAIDLVAKRGPNGRIYAKWKPSVPTSLGVDFIAIKLALRGTRAMSGTLVTGCHACQTSYRLNIGTEGARLTGKLIIDLLSQTLGHADLRHEFTKTEYLRLSPMTQEKDVEELVFQPDLIALCWKGSAEVPMQVLGGLAVGEATGTLIAALVPSTEYAIASYQIVDLDARAHFALTTYGNDGGPAQPLALELGCSGSELSYSLSGPIKLTNSFSWPRLGITANGQWQVSTIPGEWTQGFKHDAEIAFEGQRISPAGLAMREDVVLMAEVRNTLSLNSPAADVSAMKRMQWRAFQAVRLLPLARLRTMLEQAKPPLPGADLKAGPTAFSPLLSKHDLPLITHSAGLHILQTGAANPGNLSGVLAERLLAYMDTHPVDALAFDFSNHALLAFDPETSGAGKLAAPLVLSSLPALAFASAKEGVKVVPDTANDELARMFASRPEVDTTLYLAMADTYAAHHFPPLDPRMAAQAVTRIMQANAALDSQSADLATRVVKSAIGSGWHDAQLLMPVFQAVLFREVKSKPAQLAYEELPAAAVAFLLSEMFAQESDPAPLAIGFAQHGRIARADFFNEGTDDDEMDDARDFNPQVYQRSLGRFRDWAARNIVPGPDVLPRAQTRATPSIVVQADTLSIDGSAIVTLGSITISALTRESWQRAQEWGRRTLQRSAPWAAYGMLTARASGFGLDPLAKFEVIRTRAASQTRPQRSETMVKQGIPAQPQRELVAPLTRPVPGLVAGYVPMHVAPALFKSERDDDPRLSATGVTVSWMLAAGAGALVRPGPADSVAGSNSDEFWITDRERIAFRPAKRMKATADPAELTFILPEHYGAALPRALTPAASTIAAQPLPASDDTTFEQAYAPPRVATGRIAARAGAWTSTRTGLVQSGIAHADGVPEEKQALLACRASETPVHVRQPRPALLARNDRPRASSHENDVQVSAARRQSFVVHGPRAARAGGDLERVGLNRNPRSLWATRLALEAPSGSIIARDWDGAITIAVETWLGKLDEPDKAAQWTVDSAVLVVNALRYVAAPLKDATITRKAAAASLRFDRFALQGALPVQARAALRDLAPATPIDFELNLTHSSGAGPDQVILNRQVRFALLSGGGTAHGVETPLFFRFDDPEFNDRLGGLAKFKRIASPISPGDDFVFAAEVSECRPTQRIELALALKAATSGAKVAMPMLSTAHPKDNPTDKILYYGDAPVRLMIERLRKDTAAYLTANDVLCVTNTIWDRDQGRFLHLDPVGVETQFFAMTIDCGLLRLKGEDLPALMAGDQLKLSLITCEADCTAATSQATTLVSLTLDVVNRPTLPSNAAAFAVLTLEQPTGGAATVDTHLYAYGPEPAVIEIVDPRDLIDGLVRRRAVYMWRSFHHFKPTVSYYFALQKISGGGATWLPASLTNGWIRMGD